MSIDSRQTREISSRPPAEFGVWQTEARGNWVWLVPLPSRKRALELAPPGSNLPGALSRHFDRVDTLAVNPSERLPFEDAIFSCAALHDARDLLEGASAGRVLAECFRVIAPGGWLYVGMSNATWVGSMRQSPLRWMVGVALETIVGESNVRTPVRAIRRSLLDAGFTEVRRYLAAPSQLAPHVLIPANSRAVVAHAQFERKRPARRRMRTVVARLGCYAPFYPVEVLLCRR